MNKIIAKYIGGSHAYGLATPLSDVDLRGVYLLGKEDVGLILDPYLYSGSNKHVDNNVDHAKGDDHCFYELRHFFRILRACNSNAVEMLFNRNWQRLDPIFKKVVDNAHSLLDPEKFFMSLRGYMIGELRLALGERKGDLGSKRKAAIDTYGFSPKNFVQLLRLAYCGQRLFTTGEYPLDLQADPVDEAKQLQLMLIKLSPEKFQLEDLKDQAAQAFTELDTAWALHKEKISKLYTYDLNVQNEIVLEAYYPVLKSCMPEQFTDTTL